MKVITMDPKKCVGCRNCEMACAFASSAKSCEREYSNIKVYHHIEDKLVMPVTCFHCEQAWCMQVCPANAISRDPKTNAVCIDQSRCAGCKMCILACPYGNIHFDTVNLVSHKCNLCEGEPSCVTHCIAGALQYEEIEDYVDRKRNRVDAIIGSRVKHAEQE